MADYAVELVRKLGFADFYTLDSVDYLDLVNEQNLVERLACR